jgi:hypothetical protein
MPPLPPCERTQNASPVFSPVIDCAVEVIVMFPPLPDFAPIPLLPAFPPFPVVPVAAPPVPPTAETSGAEPPIEDTLGLPFMTGSLKRTKSAPLSTMFAPLDAGLNAPAFEPFPPLVSPLPPLFPLPPGAPRNPVASM